MSDNKRQDPIDRAMERAAALDERPWNVFVMPEELAVLSMPGGKPIKSVALVELTPHELRMVSKACGDDSSKIAQEELVYSIVAINCDEMGGGGEVLSAADGSADKVVAKMHARVFDMCLSGFRALHENPVPQRQAFLKTRKVVTRA